MSKAKPVKTKSFSIEEKDRLTKIHQGIVRGRWFWIIILGLSSVSLVITRKMSAIPLFSSYHPKENVGFYLITLFLVFYNFLFWLYLKQGEKCTEKGLNNLRYLQVGCDLALVTALYNLIGGIDNPTLLLYLVPILVSIMLFSAKGVFIVTTLSLHLAVFITLAEHFGLIVHKFRYLIPIGIFGNLPITLYFLTTFALSLYGASIFANFLADILSQKEKKLREKTSQMEEVNTILEIKVQARTRAMQDLTDSLEQQVKVRTEELEGKIKEVERFNKLASGREMKLLELEKEIKTLKDELKTAIS